MFALQVFLELVWKGACRNAICKLGGTMDGVLKMQPKFLYRRGTPESSSSTLHSLARKLFHDEDRHRPRPFRMDIRLILEIHTPVHLELRSFTTNAQPRILRPDPFLYVLLECLREAVYKPVDDI